MSDMMCLIRRFRGWLIAAAEFSGYLSSSINWEPVNERRVGQAVGSFPGVKQIGSMATISMSSQF